MPDRSHKKPRDLNALAAAIVSEATGEQPEEPEQRLKESRCRRAGSQGRARPVRNYNSAPTSVLQGLTPAQRIGIAEYVVD